MSSHSSDCVEIRHLSNSVDLEQLVQELSLTTYERVLLSGDQGVFIPELGHKIRSVCQLTTKQFARLTDQQRFQILSFMANDPNPLEHCRSRRQPVEGGSSSTNPPAAQPS